MAGTKNLSFELKMCGKGIYVQYFNFWDKPEFDEQPIRELMLKNKKDEDGIRMCIQAARRIAESELQSDALTTIVNSPRVKKEVRERAMSLLRKRSSRR